MQSGLGSRRGSRVQHRMEREFRVGQRMRGGLGGGEGKRTCKREAGKDPGTKRKKEETGKGLEGDRGWQEIGGGRPRKGVGRDVG